MVENDISEFPNMLSGRSLVNSPVKTELSVAVEEEEMPAIPYEETPSKGSLSSERMSDQSSIKTISFGAKGHKRSASYSAIKPQNLSLKMNSEQPPLGMVKDIN